MRTVRMKFTASFSQLLSVRSQVVQEGPVAAQQLLQCICLPGCNAVRACQACRASVQCLQLTDRAKVQVAQRSTHTCKYTGVSCIDSQPVIYPVQICECYWAAKPLHMVLGQRAEAACSVGRIAKPTVAPLKNV
jgi:hypothetical protein